MKHASKGRRCHFRQNLFPAVPVSDHLFTHKCAISGFRPWWEPPNMQNRIGRGLLPLEGEVWWQQNFADVEKLGLVWQPNSRVSSLTASNHPIVV